MPRSLLAQGNTDYKNAIKNLVSHVALTDDDTPFNLEHTGINPAGGATSTLVKPSTNTDVDAHSFTANITINGDTEFTNKFIYAIGVSKGTAIRQIEGSEGVHNGGGTVGVDTISRTVRLPLGIQAGDLFTVGSLISAEDNS